MAKPQEELSESPELLHALQGQAVVRMLEHKPAVLRALQGTGGDAELFDLMQKTFGKRSDAFEAFEALLKREGIPYDDLDWV